MDKRRGSQSDQLPVVGCWSGSPVDDDVAGLFFSSAMALKRAAARKSNGARAGCPLSTIINFKSVARLPQRSIRSALVVMVSLLCCNTNVHQGHCLSEVDS